MFDAATNVSKHHDSVTKEHSSPAPTALELDRAGNKHFIMQTKNATC